MLQRSGSSTQGYVAALEELGCEVQWLPPLAAHADGVFVEDTAVLVPELTVALARERFAPRRGGIGRRRARPPHAAGARARSGHARGR
jgi:hypothetical protein